MIAILRAQVVEDRRAGTALPDDHDRFRDRRCRDLRVGAPMLDQHEARREVADELTFDDRPPRSLRSASSSSDRTSTSRPSRHESSPKSASPIACAAASACVSALGSLMIRRLRARRIRLSPKEPHDDRPSSRP